MVDHTKHKKIMESEAKYEIKEWDSVDDLIKIFDLFKKADLISEDHHNKIVNVNSFRIRPRTMTKVFFDEKTMKFSFKVLHNEVAA